MMQAMTFSQLEDLYDALAAGLDRVAPDRRTVVLAKLVLLIANELGQGDRILPLIDAAIRDHDLAAGPATTNQETASHGA